MLSGSYSRGARILSIARTFDSPQLHLFSLRYEREREGGGFIALQIEIS